jgi:hypothetical protein
MAMLYWMFTFSFTLRGNDAEQTQLPDLFLMESAAGSLRGKKTKALVYSTNESKTNNVCGAKPLALHRASPSRNHRC